MIFPGSSGNVDTKCTDLFPSARDFVQDLPMFLFNIYTVSFFLHDYLLFPTFEEIIALFLFLYCIEIIIFSLLIKHAYFSVSIMFFLEGWVALKYAFVSIFKVKINSKKEKELVNNYWVEFGFKPLIPPTEILKVAIPLLYYNYLLLFALYYDKICIL